jgi:hypothetical protein
LTTRPDAYIDRRIVVGYESSDGMAIQRGADPRRYGVNFLLLSDHDLKSNWKNITLTPIESRDGTTLYRVD